MTNPLTLEAPAAVAPVSAGDAAGLVPIDDGTKSELEAKADRYVRDLVALNPNGPDFAVKAGQLAALGRREISVLADQSHGMLERSSKQLGEGSVGAGLARLRGIAGQLDPNRKGNLLEPRRILGIVPAGSKLKAYFDQYAPAQKMIEAILRELSDGRDQLLQDNIAISGERRRIWEQMGQLEQIIHLARTLDDRLEAAAAALDHSDPAKARAVREGALWQVRQRTTDLLTQMAVSTQGYMALDLIRKNNLELIKGVERASTTTIAALRTAITVAQALAGQKLVLDQIAALNGAASNLIESNGNSLRENGNRIAGETATATVNVEALQRAFANIYSTIDAVDAFKSRALDNMKQTVDALSAETDKARHYIERSGAVGETRAGNGFGLD